MVVGTEVAAELQLHRKLRFNHGATVSSIQKTAYLLCKKD